MDASFLNKLDFERGCGLLVALVIGSWAVWFGLGVATAYLIWG